MKRTWFVPAVCLSLILPGLTGLSRAGEVTSERLVRALEEPQNWLTYRGDYSGQNYRPLKQIHKGNVADLRVDWVFQTGVGAAAKFQTVPLVVDGMMYITAPYNNGYALDARTGRRLWRYQRSLPDQSLCCGPINRGFALLRDKLFMATLDSHLVALDTKTGNVLWDIERADYRIGYSSTGAPLIVKDKVIIGTGGGEYGVRCFVDAYDPDTGKRLWRFWTIPAAGEPGSETWLGDSWKTGGAPTWMTGTYDPELDLLYWCTGNPAPDLNGETRLGDNLYSASVVALDPDTGKMKWYFQFTPHDVHDWDANEVPVLLDLEMDGKPRKLLVQSNRNGFYYVLDRETGEFLHANAVARVTWASGIDANGRPMVLPNTAPTPGRQPAVPGNGRRVQLDGAFLQSRRRSAIRGGSRGVHRLLQQRAGAGAGPLLAGELSRVKPDEDTWGVVKALVPTTGEVKWEFKFHTPTWAGTLSTAGGLVFVGDMEGYLTALDAHTGKSLWRFQTGSPITTHPITYMLDGKQIVAVAAGSNLFTFSWRLENGLIYSRRFQVSKFHSSESQAFIRTPSISLE